MCRGTRKQKEILLGKNETSGTVHHIGTARRIFWQLTSATPVVSFKNLCGLSSRYSATRATLGC